MGICYALESTDRHNIVFASTIDVIFILDNLMLNGLSMVKYNRILRTFYYILTFTINKILHMFFLTDLFFQFQSIDSGKSNC